MAQTTQIKATAGLLAVLVFLSTPGAAVPLQFSVQGRLTDAQGVNRDGQNFEITVRIWSAATGGTLLYEETRAAVPVTNGNFQILIGGSPTQTSPNASLDAVFNGSVAYLEFQVTGEQPMVPRQPLLSTPNAIHAGESETAKSLSPGATAAGDVTVQGILNAAGYRLNGSELDSGLYVAVYATSGIGYHSINLNTGEVSGGELVFLGGKKFPVGASAIGIAVIQHYSVGFCQQGNGEYVDLGYAVAGIPENPAGNYKRVAVLPDVTRITMRDINYGCAGTGQNGAIFIGR